MKDMPEPCSDVAGRLILEWQVRAPTELPTSASSSFSMKDRRIPPCLCRNGLAELPFKKTQQLVFARAGAQQNLWYKMQQARALMSL